LVRGREVAHRRVERCSTEAFIDPSPRRPADTRSPRRDERGGRMRDLRRCPRQQGGVGLGRPGTGHRHGQSGECFEHGVVRLHRRPQVANAMSSGPPRTLGELRCTSVAHSLRGISAPRFVRVLPVAVRVDHGRAFTASATPASRPSTWGRARPSKYTPLRNVWKAISSSEPVGRVMVIRGIVEAPAVAASRRQAARRSAER
jgi:hypothetical protein